MTTTEIAHRHSFPVNDPEVPNPGVCACGRTVRQAQADRALDEALDAVAAAYGVPPRVSEHWALAWGSRNLNDGTGYVDLYDDEEDAREHLQWRKDCSVVKRAVIALRWEAVPDAGEPSP